MLTDAAKTLLIKKGSDVDFGARPLRRAIENYVEDPLSEELLKGEFNGKSMITVDVKEVAWQKAALLRRQRRRGGARGRRRRHRDSGSRRHRQSARRTDFIQHGCRSGLRMARFGFHLPPR